MPTNDFQVWAATATNIESQVAYLADPGLSNGVGSGIGSSAQANKTWRQASVWGSVLGQLINNTTGQNATDDGTTATLLANLIASISAQSESIIGGARNARMSIATASASGTFTADEIIVGTALGGLKYTLASFSQTVNLATVGANGMDTGTAPASGYVALYAIYNPTASTSALLGVNATSGVQPEVYGGTHMPAGYTASALVSVWSTNASRQFAVGVQRGRQIDTAILAILATSTPAVSPTSLSLASAVPPNAQSIIGTFAVTSSVVLGGASITIYSSNALTGAQGSDQGVNATGVISGNFVNLQLAAPQTTFYTLTSNAGTPTVLVNLTGYSF